MKIDNASYDAGFQDGFAAGLDRDREDAQKEAEAHEAAGFSAGWSAGYDDGLAEGHAQGLGLLMDEASSAPAVYLSSRYARREEMRGYAAELGAMSTARWLTTELEDLKEQALMDFEDLRKSTVLVTFTEDIKIHCIGTTSLVEAGCAASLARGGRHVEFGLAYAMGLTCIVVGKLENVFHSLPGVLQFDHWHECLEFLRS